MLNYRLNHRVTEYCYTAALALLLSSGCFAESNTYAQAKVANISDEKHNDDYALLTKRLNHNPDDIAAGENLRELCRAKKQQVQCIEILNGLAKKHPRNKNIRYHTALAYVDEVPGHTLCKKGWYLTRSLSHMSEVIEFEPIDWGAYYIRGLNSIYCPKSFRRIHKAIRDLEKCTELSEKLPAGLWRPYHVLGYLALGDAYVRAGELEKARAVYRKRKVLHPSKKNRPKAGA